MPNIFWYLLVAGIGLAVSVATICIKRKIFGLSTLLVLYLSSAGMSWVAEFEVLGLFDSYAYKTGVIDGVWSQNLLGHLILNTTLYPMVAVVMISFSLSYGWIAFVAALFTSIEFFFIKIGVYEQHWWKTYMTVITSVAYLLFVRWWYSTLTNKPTKAKQAFTLYFVALVIIHFPAPVLLLLGMQNYEWYLLDKYYTDFYLSSILFIFTYHVVECFLAVLFTVILRNRLWKAAPFIISIGAQSFFAKAGILQFGNGWNLIYTIIVYSAFIALFELLEHFYSRNSSEKNISNQIFTS